MGDEDLLWGRCECPLMDHGFQKCRALDKQNQAQLIDMLLSQFVEFEGVIYEGGALGVWEATVRSYFDERIYPLRRTAVIRSEDFLFHFDEVMDALASMGLQRRAG